VDALAARLRDDPLSDPMREEVVAVPSRGAERWLSQQLAERLDHADGEATNGSTGQRAVCAGVRFPFPGALVEEVVAAANDERTPASGDPWRADALTWQVLTELDELATGSTEEALAPLRHHLERDGRVDPSRRLPLARRIAETFDGYGLLRPDLVLAWEGEEGEGGQAGVPRAAGRHAAGAPGGTGGPDAWQSALWQRVRERIGQPSPAVRRERAIARLRHADAAVAESLGRMLPPRLAVFGVTALPPAHLRLLAALGGVLEEVALYLLVPSPRLGTGEEPAEPRNPLLSSLGRLSRGMAEVTAAPRLRDRLQLTRLDPKGAHRPATGIAQPTVLEALQAHVVADEPAPEQSAGHGQDAELPDHLRASGPASEPAGADGSVQVHGCHGPTRQVEVLREVITGLLSADRTLQPRDVLVMTPDLDTFAPLVSAVFDEVPGWREDGQPALPAKIADRRLDASNEVAAVLGGLLDLAGGRLAASAVLDLLATTPVRARFGLDDPDLETLAAWVRTTGIHWGADAEHRGAHGQPAQAAHTWQAGLDRLRAGVAMADEDGRTVAGLVPYDDLEGEQLERLGRAVTAIETLTVHVRALEAAATPPVWRDRLRAALDALTAVGRDEAWQRQQALELLDGLVDAAAGAQVEVTLAELRGEVQAKLGRRPAAARYATGAITVCELAPLRAVPHRVVCLLGLDDGAFPRTAAPLGFDLVAASPRAGDRDPRDEDRQLLLDAILAARGHLIATYTSRDPHRNDPRPPAAPLAELLEAVATTRGLPAEKAHEHLVTEHPLQPYDPRYFANTAQTDDDAPADDASGARPGLPRSFDPRQRAAAQAHRGPRRALAPFAADALPPPDDAKHHDETDQLALATLEDFHANPVRHLLRDRVGLAVHLGEESVDDRDQWDLDGLQQWRLRDAYLRLRLAGYGAQASRQFLALEQARGDVPPGAPGRHALTRAEQEAEAILAELAGATSHGDALAPAELGRLDLGTRVEITRPHPPDPAAGGAATSTGSDTPAADAGRALRLVGAVDGVTEDSLVLVQASKVDARVELRGWLRLLVAAVATDPGADGAGAAHAPVSRVTIIGYGGSGKAASRTLELPEEEDPVACARQRLAELVAVREHGLRRALPLLPRTTKALVEAGWQPGAAIPKKARNEWEGGWGNPGEGEDDAVALAFGPDVDLEDLLEAEHLRLAEHVWRPILGPVTA